MLRTTVGLHDSWTCARSASRQKKSREAWLALVAGHPCFGVKLLRAQSPAVYAWLYRNDREWLTRNLPLPAKPEGPHRSHVRWDERDLRLSHQVQEIAMQLSGAGDGKKEIKLWEIYQRLPELKAKLDVLDRLPQTRRTLETVVKRRAKPLRDQLLLAPTVGADRKLTQGYADLFLDCFLKNYIK